jgi:NAD(P)-dependent dehydrogenase (short-subunit alcohol dehydrogenase family)
LRLDCSVREGAMSRLPEADLAPNVAGCAGTTSGHAAKTAFDLSGKIALVTGASGGLGRHFALTLAVAGAKVALAARRTDQTAAVAAEIESGGGTAIAVSMDVTDEAAVKRAFAETSERLGPPNVVVNNSGIAKNEPALELTLADWDHVLNTNTRGAFVVSRAAARALIAAKSAGSIINVASILGLRVAGRVAPYAASKAALIQLTRSLALEWARYNIRVNAIAPGYIETDLNRDFFSSEAGLALINRIPQRRLGRAQELDGALLLLASDASTYMTGSTLVVDGGHLNSTL